MLAVVAVEQYRDHVAFASLRFGSEAFRGAVLASIIDEDDLPRCLERCARGECTLQEIVEVADLVVHGDDDRHAYSGVFYGT